MEPAVADVSATAGAMPRIKALDRAASARSARDLLILARLNSTVKVQYGVARASPRSVGLRDLRLGRLDLRDVAKALMWVLGAAFFCIATLAMYGHLIPAYLLMARYYAVGDVEPVLDFTVAEFFGIVVGNVVGGIVAYHALCYALYRLYYINQGTDEQRAQWKLQPNAVPSDDVVREEIRLSHISVVVSTAFSGLQLAYLTKGGASRLIFDASEYSTLYIIGSCCGAFLIQDFFMYATHRLLHDWPYLMRTIHSVHHKFKHPTPYSVLAMHWVEAVFLEAALILPVFFFRIWVPYFYFSLFYVLVSGVAGHSGIDLPALLPWQAPPWFHDHHHLYSRGNYGSSLLVWDYLMGTYRPRDNTKEELRERSTGEEPLPDDDDADETDGSASPVSPAESSMDLLASPAAPPDASAATSDLRAFVSSVYRRLWHRA